MSSVSSAICRATRLIGWLPHRNEQGTPYLLIRLLRLEFPRSAPWVTKLQRQLQGGLRLRRGQALSACWPLPIENVAHGGGVPLAAARGPHSASVQCPCNRSVGSGAAGLYLPDHGQHVRREVSAVTWFVATPLALASARLVRLPSVAPCAFFAARAAIVRAEIRLRSFSANAA